MIINLKKSHFIPFLILVSFLSISIQFKAATCVALVTDDWEKAATWSCGRVPTCNDSVVIPAFRTVTITTQLDYTGCGGPMAINIYGTLHFQSGKKLLLACGSMIYVQTGGQITGGGGGGNSNLIDICGSTAWNAGMGDVSGPVTLSSGGIAPMPVELLYFTAKNNNNTTVKLNWATATESNNDHFEIERSPNGNLFVPIASINASGTGNSILTQYYEYTDPKPLSGTSYYRLKQVDRNGDFEIFNIVSVNFDRNKNISFSIYPNPNAGEFNVDFSGVENNHEVIVLMQDLQGKQVYAGSFYTEQNNGTFNISPEKKIAKGAYICSIIVEGVKYSLKVMVN